MIPQFPILLKESPVRTPSGSICPISSDVEPVMVLAAEHIHVTPSPLTPSRMLWGWLPGLVELETDEGLCRMSLYASVLSSEGPVDVADVQQGTVLHGGLEVTDIRVCNVLAPFFSCIFEAPVYVCVRKVWVRMDPLVRNMKGNQNEDFTQECPSRHQEHLQ